MRERLHYLWWDVKWYVKHPLADLVRKVRLHLGHGHLCDYRYHHTTGERMPYYTGYCNAPGFHRGRNA